MLIENFSAMVQNADQAPGLIRAVLEFSSGQAAALAQAATENQGNFLAFEPWTWGVPGWY